MPHAAWQIAPPGPTDAAVDPPPCSPGDGAAITPRAPLADEYHADYPPPLPHEIPFPNFVPHHLVYGPFAAPRYTTDPETKIGTETPAARLKELENASHDNAAKG